MNFYNNLTSSFCSIDILQWFAKKIKSGQLWSISNDFLSLFLFYFSFLFFFLSLFEMKFELLHDVTIMDVRVGGIKFATWTIIQTSLKHCLRIPPLDIFFSASSSPKFKELAKISTSAMLTSLCRKETATSIGIPWVGSITSNSLYEYPSTN